MSSREHLANGAMFWTGDSRSKSKPSMMASLKGAELGMRGLRPKVCQTMLALLIASEAEEKPPSV